MATDRFQPSLIKNKIKREEIARKNKKSKRQDKLRKRLERAKVEANDPLAKKVNASVLPLVPAHSFYSFQKRLAENVPRTLDNTREFDPSALAASQSNTRASNSNENPTDESLLDISSDPFASYFASAFDSDPSIPPKVLITTSFKSSKLTFEFCDELVSVIPGAEFIRRKKGQGFEMGRVAVWAAERGYTNMIVVNEDMKKPST